MLPKTIFAVLLIFSAVFCCESASLDVGNSCIARYLMERNKLEHDFPIANTADLENAFCRLVMPIVLKSFENVLCQKMREKESINHDCVMDFLKKEGALDYMFKQEVILMSKSLTEEDSKFRLEDVKEQLRNIFEEAARICDSDPTYAGLFNDILEIKNESLAVLRQDYCFIKFAIESKLLEVQDVDFNPKKIVTSNIDCQTMIKKNRAEREKKLLETMRTRNLTEDQIHCVRDKFQIERAFDSNLALEVIDHIDVPLEVRRANRERIAEKLEKFIESIFICIGRRADKNQSTILKI